jgi:hypothetical protein
VKISASRQWLFETVKDRLLLSHDRVEVGINICAAKEGGDIL